VHRYAASCEGQRDSAGSDPKLERASASGDFMKEVDDRVYDLRIEHVGR